MDKTVYYKAPTEDECPPKPEGYTYLLYLSGACTFYRRVSMFPISSESGTLVSISFFVHSEYAKYDTKYVIGFPLVHGKSPVTIVRIGFIILLA